MSELIWYPQRGYGKVEGEFEYGDVYWNEFRGKDQTPVGKILTEMRRNFVIRNLPNVARSRILDIGIGGGAFVTAMDCQGVDINPLANAWLTAENRAWDRQLVAVMTFWDSMEHMSDPEVWFPKCESLVYISTPIYESAEHCVHSKHFKPGEHLLYFTDVGLKRFMAEHGFGFRESNRMEESVGREDIGTYVFSRVC